MNRLTFHSLGPLVALLTLFVSTLFLGACGLSSGDAQRLSGQECQSSSECLGDSACVNRRCVPRTVRRGDAQPVEPGDAGHTDLGHDDVHQDDVSPNDVSPGDVSHPDTAPNDDVMPPPQDAGPGDDCMLNSLFCLDETTAAACVAGPDGRPVVERTSCGAGEYCAYGACTRDQQPPPPTCCAGGCGDNAFCLDCTCQVYNADQCLYQQQPCSRPESFENGFYCMSLGEREDYRCYGLCMTDADDPDATCPGANSVCAFGEDEVAICLSGCNMAQGCGEPELGCLPLQNDVDEGVCIPTNTDHQIGDRCDPDQFLDCAAGAICIPDEQGNGTCRAACRPFAHGGGGATDCPGQDRCLVLTPNLGVCNPTIDASEGDSCNEMAVSCGEDAVACYPWGFGQQRCTRLCRLELGSTDCGPGTTCTQYDPSQTELGFCN